MSCLFDKKLPLKNNNHFSSYLSGQFSSIFPFRGQSFFLHKSTSMTPFLLIPVFFFSPISLYTSISTSSLHFSSLLVVILFLPSILLIFVSFPFSLSSFLYLLFFIFFLYLLFFIFFSLSSFFFFFSLSSFLYLLFFIFFSFSLPQSYVRTIMPILCGTNHFSFTWKIPPLPCWV